MWNSLWVDIGHISILFLNFREREREASYVSFHGITGKNGDPVSEKLQVRFSENWVLKNLPRVLTPHRLENKTRVDPWHWSIQTNPKQFFSLNIFSVDFRFRRWRYPSPQIIQQLFSDISNLVLVSDPVGRPIGLLFGLHMGRPLRELKSRGSRLCHAPAHSFYNIHRKENTFLLKLRVTRHFFMRFAMSGNVNMAYYWTCWKMYSGICFQCGICIKMKVYIVKEGFEAVLSKWRGGGDDSDLQSRMILIFSYKLGKSISINVEIIYVNVFNFLPCQKDKV